MDLTLARKAFEKDKRVARFIETESTCCLCGTILKFEYRKSSETQLLEEGYCSCCEIRAKKKEYEVH